jgi:hypothetical protein
MISLRLPRRMAPLSLTVSGWNLYRGATPTTVNQRVNASLIPIGVSQEFRYRDASAPAGAAYYRLAAVYATGREETIASADVQGAPPAVLHLAQNHPNPFNPRTTFSFSLPQTGRVMLAVYDVRGARVATLVNGELPAGTRTVEWNGTNDAGAPMPSGVYFGRLETPTGVRSVKMMLAK